MSRDRELTAALEASLARIRPERAEFTPCRGYSSYRFPGERLFAWNVTLTDLRFGEPKVYTLWYTTVPSLAAAEAAMACACAEFGLTYLGIEWDEFGIPTYLAK